jgi:glycerophosphoryl diester phosphodiesterase
VRGDGVVRGDEELRGDEGHGVIFDGKPVVVGHRGFGAGQPGGYRENTMASYQAAVAHGLSWIELDVQRSRDGQLMVAHDPVTADGAFVVTRSADELAEAGALRFDDVLADLPAGLALDVDVKTILEDALDPPGQRTGALLADLLRKHAGERELLVSSFDPGVLRYLQDQDLADAPLGLITGPNFPSGQAIPAAVGLGLTAICLHTGSFGLHREPPRIADRSPEQVLDAAHRAGLEVLVWTPGPADAARLAAAGADAVCADDVPAVLAALR